MPDARDISLQSFLDLATESSNEIGALGGGNLINYETGKIVYFVDEETAMFLASARGIVLELITRLRKCPDETI